MIFLVGMEQLSDFAEQFWHLIGEAKVIAFHGTMGAGKTTIIASLCHKRGSTDVITSPTFSIINEYYFVDNNEVKKIYHMDLYRLNSLEEVIQAGVEDCLYSGEICMVEWPEKAPELLDGQTVHVFIVAIADDKRRIKIEAPPSIRPYNQITS